MTGKRKSTVPPKRVHVRAFHRLHELVEIIQRGAYPTCADLASKLERNERTIRRDIRSLRDDFNAPLEHDRESYRHAMGHRWLGFAPANVEAMLKSAGLTAARVTALPSDPMAKGPGLFVATAERG